MWRGTLTSKVLYPIIYSSVYLKHLLHEECQYLKIQGVSELVVGHIKGDSLLYNYISL